MMTYLTPVYDTLIRRTADGSLVPAVATEWKYLDAAKTEFQMTLRTDVKFDDGSKVDAAAVKANIEDAKDAKGPFSGGLSSVTKVDAKGDTVTIHLSDPTPNLDNVLAGPVGMLVEPSALGTKGLASKPAGSGAYTVDASTVPGQTYVYKARSGYWDPKAFGPETLNLVVLSDTDARLNALVSGQVDATVVFAPQAATAKGAGLDVLEQPLNVVALGLLDRSGTMIPALKDKRVRQALNYAVDRKAIVQATAFGFGEAGDQLFAKGSPAWSKKADSFYSYNPDKARTLLKEAGFASGLTIPVFTEARFASYLEALDGYFRAVGVKLEITQADSGLIPAWSSGKYGATMVQYGDNDPVSLINTWALPTSPNNPFKAVLPGIDDLVHQINTSTSPDARSAALQKISEGLTEEAWFVPTHILDTLYGVNTKKVTGIQSYAGNSVPYVYGWKVTQK
jgi:peptide/nickel transport system substrate-binding protein